MSRLYSLLLILFSLQQILTQDVTEDVTVRIENGPITGFKRDFNGKPQDNFLGVPYAQPPVGDLRFKKPLPVNAWSDPIEAKEWPNVCPQIMLPAFGRPDEFYNTNVSEDCLYLNVLSPDVSIDVLKPVLVFIHGGALTMGSSSMKSYDPYVVVSKGDVVAVTINYRLNIFGFLYTGTEDAPGNVGLYDQALALEWVKDNVAYFGGDPEKITIFGQSAGSWSVALHFLSPMSRNLFNNAMMMSAAPEEGHPIVSREDAKSLTKQVLTIVGCGDEITSSAIKCLKNMDLDQIIKVTLPMFYYKNVSWVITGDKFLPDHPDKMLESGDFKKNSQLIVGIAEDEAGFALPLIDLQTFNPESKIQLTKSMTVNVIKKAQELNWLSKTLDIDAFMKFYLSTIPDDDEAQILKQLGIAIGHGFLGCATYKFGQRVFEGDKNSRIYGYYWSDKIDPTIAEEWWLTMCRPSVGACHAMDLIPVMGRPFKPGGRFNDRHKEISEKMIQMLVSFSKNGKPAPIDGVDWPEFYSVKEQTLTPVYDFASSDKKSGFRHNIIDAACKTVWK